MIVDEKIGTVKRSQDFKESTFKIEGSAKAFEILSSGLYTDIVLAIVRELSTNAWDSHIEAGTTDIPFVVHLPNNMEPHFSIRDYGTGLSQEDVEELYTTYFRSSKTKSNDLNGCLGLGSKSPFAYTDSFQVASYFDGTKYVYNLFKGEEGFPKVALLTSHPTDEPNGLEIIIAVKPHDFHSFAEKATKLYPYFVYPPKITGNKIDLSIEEPILEGDFWKYLSPKKDWRTPQSLAVMGNIAYPIRWSNLNTLSERILSQNGFIIQFPIGELEITANREELQWNEKTINAINARMDTIASELINHIEKEFANCKSLWEARLLFNKLFTSGGDMYHLQGIFSAGNFPKWKGQEISATVQKFERDDATFDILHVSQQNLRRVCHTDKLVNHFTASENIILMYDDLEKGGLHRARAWLKQHTDYQQKKILFAIFETREAFKETNKIFGCDESHWMKTSALPKTVRPKIGTTKSTTIMVWKQHCRPYNTNDFCWTNEELDDPASVEGVYLPVRRYRITDKQGETSDHPANLNNLYSTLLAAGLAPTKIYGIKFGSVASWTKKYPKWKNFFDYVIEAYKQYLEDNKLGTVLESHKSYLRLKHRNSVKAINKSLMRNFPSVKGCDFNKLAEEIHKIERKFSKELNLANNIWLALPSFLKSELPINSNDTLLSREEEIVNKYPLLREIFTHYRSYYSNNEEGSLAFAQYIYLFETENKK